MVFKFSRRPSWISERNDYSNSESLFRSYAYHQVSTQSDLRFGRRCRLKNFKMAAMAFFFSFLFFFFFFFFFLFLDIGTERF